MTFHFLFDADVVILRNKENVTKIVSRQLDEYLTVLIHKLLNDFCCCCKEMRHLAENYQNNSIYTDTTHLFVSIHPV